MKAKWIVKPVELYRASSKILGLKHPVSVKSFRGRWWAGEYDPFPLHVLWINASVERNSLDPNWTIWHELGHALQCERDFNSDGTAFWTRIADSYSHLIDKNGNRILNGLTEDEWLRLYEELPVEKEANEIADRYADYYPLVKIV